ncbi:MAG: hypothetical protein JJU11_13345 [Candidatus Sumerlaeia bacterium]|nr:hypothetical protein [Candidatus Sumerlaeia bacterium]
MRFFPLIASLLAVLVFSGCTHSFTSRELGDKTLPYKGGTISEETWEAMGRVNPSAPHVNTRSTVFPLPSILIFRNFSNLRPDGRYAATSFTWWDGFLGSIGISLPLAVNYNDYHYLPGESEPVAHRSAFYTPFLSGSSSEGDFDLGVDIKASGIPLLWSRVRMAETFPDGSQAIAQKTGFLWSLGPMLIKLEANEGNTSGYIATPLLLGGVPGGILWSDYRIRDRDRDTHRFGHGPLFGFLGYSQWKAHSTPPQEDANPEETRFRRLLLGGALWEQTRRSDFESGEVTSTSHGPIWGMFGWGSREGDFTLRLLWIPIRF